MKRLISYIVTLLMPLFLIGGGEALIALAGPNNWGVLFWTGWAMTAAGILRGLIMFARTSGGSL